MNAAIGILFTLVYLVLAWLLAVLGTVHGPHLFPYFVLGYLVMAEALLWWWYFFVRRRDFRRKTRLLVLGASGLGLFLIGASHASWSPLVDREIRRNEQLAAATEVFSMQDETLFSQQGNPIGIRLKYSMRFPDRNYFWHSPWLDPEEDLGFTIWAHMHVANQTIEPPMRIAATTEAPRPAGALTYEPGKVYNFTTDLIPDFLIQNATKTKLYIQKPFKEHAAGFDKLIETGGNLHYKISVSGTKYQGLTRNAYNPKTFYESARKEGALELEEIGPGIRVGRCE